MSVGRGDCSGCVLSDGRFAVLGGYSTGACTSSCEALTLDGDEHWSPLSPMRDTRANFAYAAVAGCIIVASGYPERKSAEVYEEMLGRWMRLPCYLPHDGGLHGKGSALARARSVDDPRIHMRRLHAYSYTLIRCTC
jgi:hypothetical protein